MFQKFYELDSRFEEISWKKKRRENLWSASSEEAQRLDAWSGHISRNCDGGSKRQAWDWLVPDPWAKWKLDVWARDAHEFIFSASPCTFFPPCTRHQFPCIPCRPSLYGRLAISSLTYTSILKRRSCGHSLPPSLPSSLSLSLVRPVSAYPPMRAR